MALSAVFKAKMKALLEAEYDDFIQSYQHPKTQALRVNTLKGSSDVFLNKQPFNLSPVPWCFTGFYYSETDFPGKHPYHDAGVYYIQEPSAMAVVEVLDPKPKEHILDLCAAPGGKSTHIAMKMEQQGLLISNEINSGRAKILSSNIERMGIRNAVVTNEKPEHLAYCFPNFFDRILVDAPCSGEGMFRKDEDAINQWGPSLVTMCTQRQKEILESADVMLKPGGILVYSTCTFSPEENEGVIDWLLKHHHYQLLDCNLHQFFDSGVPQWVDGDPSLTKTMRLWPHKLQGEGHFVALLQKGDAAIHHRKKVLLPEIPVSQQQLVQQFMKQTLKINLQGNYVLFDNQLYLLPEPILLKGIKTLRAGLHLGTFKTNRFEPAHALALTLNEDDVVNSQALTDEQVKHYLKGQPLTTAKTGWILVTYQGYSLGWGKGAAGILKNHYPKGLRKA